MKPILKLIGSLAMLALVFALLAILTGCAITNRKASILHERDTYAPNTNRITWLAAVFRANPYSVLTTREVWSDRYKGGGAELLNASALTSLVSVHTNQNALGGGSSLGLNGLNNDISTNASGTISAAGTAVGNVIGAAANKAVTPAP